MKMEAMALLNLAKSETLADRVATEILSELARRRQSQAKLAAALGKAPMWVSDRLSGKTQITVNDLERIAEALELKVGDLLPREDRQVKACLQTARSARPARRLDARPAAPSRPGDRRPAGRPAALTRPSGSVRTARIA